MAAMLGESELEQIVAEVVRRLQAVHADARSRRPDATAPGATQTTARPDETQVTELQLDGPVVTVETIRGRLAGRRRVVVGAKAIVTPAVRDELRSAGIELVRAASPAVTHTARLHLVNATHDVDLGGVARKLTELRVGIRHVTATDLPAAVGSLADALRTTRDLGALITRQPERALILANRRRNVRAVELKQAERLTNALQETAANVLVLDAAGRGELEIVRALEALIGTPPVVVPQGL